MPGQVLAGGGLPKHFVESLTKRCITTLDFLEDAALTLANAALTAEGLLSVLIAQTPVSLHGCKALLLGFGRCGKEIGRLLQCFGVKLFVLDHDESCLMAAKEMGIGSVLKELEDCLDYDILINTVPERILTSKQLGLLPKECVLFDIASAPFGFEPAVVEKLELKLVNCPGLPGRFMPKTAGELLGKSMLFQMDPPR
jgi:dipicolinate synthase subunit A